MITRTPSRRGSSRSSGRRTRLAWLLLAALAAGCAGGRQRAPDTGQTSSVARRPFEHAPVNLVEALAAISAELRGVGLVQYGPTASGFLPAGGRQAFAIDLPGDRCMTMVAIATPGVTDMDAALYTPDGELLAADSQPDSHPAIHVCGTGETRTVYYVVHSYEGAGSFLMASFSGGMQAVDALASKLGGRPAVASDIHGPRSARQSLTDFGEGLYRRGFRRQGEATDVQLAERQRVRVAIPVTAGRCYAVAAFGEGGLRQLDVRVLDHAGAHVVGDQAPLPAARVQFCAAESAAYALEAHAVLGDGIAIVGVYDAPAHEVLGEGGLWLGRKHARQTSPPPEQHDALAKALEQARAAGFSTVEARFEGQLSPGEVVQHPLTVGRRRCLRFLFAPSESLVAADLVLLREGQDRQRFQMGQLATRTPVELCAAQGETMQLRVIAMTGAGGYTLSVFSR